MYNALNSIQISSKDIPVIPMSKKYYAPNLEVKSTLSATWKNNLSAQQWHQAFHDLKSSYEDLVPVYTDGSGQSRGTGVAVLCGTHILLLK
jgi:hypothetical protein